MSKPIMLHIPEPCHENWDNMTPQDKGRHCQSCNKIVVDFSVMTDRQVLDYFKNTKGNTCGRFHSDQLERPIVEPQKQPGKWNYFIATITSFFLGIKLFGQEKLQGKVAFPTLTTTTQSNEVKHTKGEVAPQMKTISGRVTDEKGAAIAGVSVTIDKSAKGSITDSNGRFTMNVPIHAKTITCRGIGLEPKTFSIPSNKNEYINIKMSYAKEMGDVNITVGGIGFTYLDDRDYYPPSTPIYDIKGVIVDENDNAINNAIVIVDGTEANAKSDYRGEFEIENIKKYNLKTLHITATGYKSKDIVITNKVLDEIEDLKIVLQKEEVKAIAINNLLKGKITNEKGELIAGASVVIKGTKIGSSSKQDGSFEINKLSDNAKLTLVISSIGYETKTIEIESKDSKNELSIVLKDEIKKLDEVVVNTGISKVRKNFYGGAVSIVSVSKIDTPIVEKVIIKPIQKLLNIEPVKVYPNPASKNFLINIVIKKTGKYQIHLIDAQSKLIKTVPQNTTANNQLIQFQLPENMSSGNYFIQLVDENYKATTEKIIVL